MFRLRKKSAHILKCYIINNNFFLPGYSPKKFFMMISQLYVPVGQKIEMTNWQVKEEEPNQSNSTEPAGVHF